MLKVLKSGVFSSIQDQGRHHYRSYGVPISGAMDNYAFEMANQLIGNDSNSAVIEIIFGGAEFLALEDVNFVIAGANLDPKINGRDVEMWKPIKLSIGEKLKFSGPKSGVIAYLSIEGGVESNSYLGSQSTFEKAGFGRAMKRGDVIKSKQESMTNQSNVTSMEIPTYVNHTQVRVIPSPHEQLFIQNAIQQFYGEAFKVIRGDRMGAILEGSKPLKLKQSIDLVSEAVTFGTIQVPPNGHPMILLADAQTTGGYPTIGTIHTEDLWRVAQIPPNGEINFKRVTNLL